MNRAERIVYNTVKNFPFLKSLIRNTYQRIMLFANPPRQKEIVKHSLIVKEGFFFGFHDKIPWSPDNSKLLAHKIKNEKGLGCEGEISIGYFDKDLNKYNELAPTPSWNWQQGSMLQWLNNERIVFNYWDGKKNTARLMDLKGDLVKDLGLPISVVSNCESFGLSFSFDRLGKGMPGYGYQNTDKNNRTVDDLEPEDTGIHLYDFNYNTSKLLFSVSDIANYKREVSMNGAYHFLTHTQFSPDSKRFLFLHRWQSKGGKRVNTRLLTSDLYGENINLFNTNGMVSHLTWLNSNKILAYASTIKYGDAYTIFSDGSNEIKILDKEKFSVDGHPQLCKVNGLVVSDSYPNRSRMQQLFCINMESEEKKILGSFFSPLKFREAYRCDLHPRWDRLGTAICFDSAHTGKRSICVLKLDMNEFIDKQ